MKTSIWTRLIITVLALCVTAALATPASGQTLRRDGSKAVPFVADVSTQSGVSSSGPVRRKDGSKAVPFVANVGTEAAPPTDTAAPTDGFDWGDGAIGAGLGAAAALLAGAGAYAVRRRPSFGS